MTRYRKKITQEMTPWFDGVPMQLISISVADKRNGSPKKGDMIAYNPEDASDRWLVAEKFFNDNYELSE